MRRRAALVLLMVGCGGESTGATGDEGQTPTQPVVYVPGNSYFGDNDYVEYIAGNLPLIFSAPHGGALTPSTIAARVAGGACGPDVTIATDANTEDLARQIKTAFFERTGKYPHIIINRLNRNRLDANREIVEAACGNGQAQEAWRDYHEFIGIARTKVASDNTTGFYTDLHGHGHAIARLELGYDLSGATLRGIDAELDANATTENAASIRAFSVQSPLSFSALLRGPSSLGTLFTNAGYPSVPSQQDPSPDAGEEYFSGGYNTERHSCILAGQICGVQIEANFAGVRDTPANRLAFATAIANVYSTFLAPFGINF